MKSVVTAFLAGLMGLVACSKSATSDESKSVLLPDSTALVKQPADTVGAFRLATYWVKPDTAFKFTALLSASDTLHIVACQRYLIEPFGAIASKQQLNSSLLRNFAVTTKYEKQENGTFLFHVLTLRKNRLILHFENDPEAARGSYVFEGEINDSNVAFANDIRIGMTAKSFYQQFFKNFPLALLDKYQTVVFDFCTDDIRHIYDFRNGRLVTVKFSQPSGFWRVNH